MLIVQKYGGTSLIDAEAISNVARRIGRVWEEDKDVVVVVSAMGDSTSRLTELAHSIADKPEPREMDLLLSTGELVSCTLVTMALRSLGVDAISLTGAQAGIITDKSHGNAKIESVEPRRILKELSRGRVVIVAGFQGANEAMDTTTLGLGASDLTAVAVAASLGAERCEIYTDVDGIYTADPKLVPDAQKLDEIGFEEMLEMASYGAKMNPRSVEVGMVYDMPILVASSFTDKLGTLIHGGANMGTKIRETRNRVRGVAADTDVAKITLQGVPDRPGIAAEVFEPLAEADISVDIIVQNASVNSATDLTFTVKRTEVDRAVEITRGLADKLGVEGITADNNLAKVSIVGTGMQDVPGYAAKLFRALADAKINVEMISTSEIRITCIVSESKIGESARAIHSAFELDKVARYQ